METQRHNAVRGKGAGWRLRHTLLMAVFAVLSTCAMAEARPVTCESTGGTQFCPVDTRGGVRLIRQLSRAGCYEGRTWGYDRHGIWVTQGCRAQFETEDARPDYYGGGNREREYWPYDDTPRRGMPRTITCESYGSRDNYCRAPLYRAQVDIVRQLSKKPCRYGQNWGWDEVGIWVTDGCRAVFSIH